MEHLLITPSRTVEDPGAGRACSGDRALRTRHDQVWLRALGLGIPLAILCAPIAGDLVHLWWNRYGFSHGFLVPLISLYLGWLQWPRLRQTPLQPAIVAGWLWLASATAVLLASEVAGVITMGSVAFVLVLAGLVLLLCGYAYLKALAFPLAYLLFMTPVLDLLTEPLVWPFQLLTAGMSASLLQALGIPVLLDEHIRLILPTVTLEVVRECSGAGLLVALLAIGLPLAYLTLQAWWSRITLVLSSVAVAIVANWVRVAVMGIYAQAGGKDLHGPYHILQGLFVDWVAFGFLFLGAWLLGTLERAAPRETPPPAQPPSLGHLLPSAASPHTWWLACLTLTAAALAFSVLDRGASGLTKDLETFPAVIGDWVVDPEPSHEPLALLPDANQSLTRTYRTVDGRRVQLYIGYTTSQRQGKELVGMATAPLHEKAIATVVRAGAGMQAANHTLVNQRRQSIPALFWYHVDGTGYAGRYQAKLATVTQALLRGRTDGALVLLSAEPRHDQDARQWQAQEEFAGLLAPLVREYLP